ncbi:MAG: type II secretion system major pseudopilin GspG [Planctomycetaceae bacterium]|jgi:general secretion pathway protein G|nr:type II secretion system major pseudopilin GspG [Planctomycetaceae bacterium]
MKKNDNEVRFGGKFVRVWSDRTVLRSAVFAKSAKGFTLVEVMVVLFIMLAMAGAAVLAYTSFLESGKIKTTKQYISNLEVAIDSFHINVSRYPSSLQDLLECPSGISQTNWGGPYVRTLQQTDPWQNEYRYNAPGQHNTRSFDVWSPGPDCQDGTEDDIGNWK